MLKGYRLASPGAIFALISFFLPWFIVSGCQGNTTVGGVDAVKLVVDNNTEIADKIRLSGPALIIPLLALFVLFMAAWAWGRGRVGKRDIITVTGAGVLLTLILAWYLVLLRDSIIQIRYGFWGELFAAALLLMGGLSNWLAYRSAGEAGENLILITPESVIPESRAKWRWGMGLGAAAFAGFCLLASCGFLFIRLQSSTSSFSSNPSPANNTLYTPPPAAPTATPAPQQFTVQVNSLTQTNIYIQHGQYVLIQADGTIKVGPFVGYVDPDGKNDTFLTGYSIVSDVPHGALLCRFRGAEWAYCGSGVAFQSDGEGYLDFEVNDNDQGNNATTDFFNVTVIVSNNPLTLPQSASTTDTSTHSTFTDSTYEADNTEFGCDVICDDEIDSDGDGIPDNEDSSPFGE